MNGTNQAVYLIAKFIKWTHPISKYNFTIA